MDGVADRRFWSFSFVSMVTLERQDIVPTLERGNYQLILASQLSSMKESNTLGSLAGGVQNLHSR